VFVLVLLLVQVVGRGVFAASKWLDGSSQLATSRGKLVRFWGAWRGLGTCAIPPVSGRVDGRRRPLPGIDTRPSELRPTFSASGEGFDGPRGSS